jgi:hypothetical protein
MQMATTIAMVMSTGYPSATPHASRCLAGRCVQPPWSWPCCLRATAAAAGPPSATTGAADVTQSSATLAGSVDPQAWRRRTTSNTGPRRATACRRADVDAGSGAGAVDASAGAHRADDRHHLPLPRRRDQRGRASPRRRSHAQDRRPPARRARRRARRAACTRRRTARGSGRPQRRPTTYHFE